MKDDPVDGLFEELIALLEDDPAYPVEGFLASHPDQASELRARLLKLRGAGLLASGETTLRDMRRLLGLKRKLQQRAELPGEGVEEDGIEPEHWVAGRYRLLEEIGRGGMGHIARTWDEDLQREVAMKLARLPDSDDEESRGVSTFLGRFLVEAQITGQLQHPGIVPVHDLGVTADERAFFTMKLVEGRSLAEIIGALGRGDLDTVRTFPLTRRVEIVRRICDALAYAHSRGIVHRDLKPGNVMIGPFGEVQLMDWGLAKILDRGDTAARANGVWSRLERSPAQWFETAHGDVFGTPSYMAPEQARAEGEVTERTDVFGAGAILYHLLAGNPPYWGDSVESVVARAERGELNDPGLARATEPVPPELVAVCRRALARAPEERYPSVQALGEDLAAFIEQRVVSAYRTGPWAEARQWMRRNRTLASVGGSLALLVTAASVTLAFLNARLATANEEVRQLSDLQVIRELREGAALLWPARQATIEAYDDWLRHSQEFEARLEEHRRKLAELEEEAADSPAPVESPTNRWWRSQLTRLVTEAEAFLDLDTGLIEGVSPEYGWGVARRRRWAADIGARSTTGAEAARRWSEACASIANPEECPSYGGLELSPRVGLLPLGRDPDSGLWEFAHLSTGEAATRDGDGRLRIEVETGLVLVLLPSARFLMGAQPDDEDGPNHDPQARTQSIPPHPVQLDAFFLSKYEMTIAQWTRIAGAPLGSQPEVGPLHPVDHISWDNAQPALARMELVLPTEAQWEYASRAGTTTPWWTGDTDASLEGAANLADQAAVQHEKAWSSPVAWNDGHAYTAPIGAYRPNAFGLHDTMGNVWEWCLDSIWSYEVLPRAGTGLRGGENDRRIFRGGSFDGTPTHALSAFRTDDVPSRTGYSTGVRPAVLLER